MCSLFFVSILLFLLSISCVRSLGLRVGGDGTGWSMRKKNAPYRIGFGTSAIKRFLVSICCTPLQCEQLFSSSVSVPFLSISKSHSWRPQPCNLCVYNVFPFHCARASSSPAKYVTLHQGLPSGVSLKPLGSTCCSQINGRALGVGVGMHHTSITPL